MPKETSKISMLSQGRTFRLILFAGHFGVQHFSHLTDADDATSSKLKNLLSGLFLKWLEMMSVTNASFQRFLSVNDLPNASLCVHDSIISIFLIGPTDSAWERRTCFPRA